MTCVLQGSFRATEDATIRLIRTDALDTVDWSITEGDAWDSADDLLAEWTAVVRADGNFGSSWTIDALRGTTDCSTRITGASWQITWSQSGDGSDLRDWLGGSGAIDVGANGTSLSAPIGASFVASAGIIQPYRTRTLRSRGQFVALDGSTQTQHGTSSGDADEVTMSIELEWGDGVSTSLDHHDQIQTFLDSLWGLAGGGEPWAVITTYGDGVTDQWSVRFADELLKVRPEMRQGAVPRTCWRLMLGPLVVESAPW